MNAILILMKPRHHPLRRLDRTAPMKKFLEPELGPNPKWIGLNLHYVYRFYDTEQQPLYFGISSGMPMRWSAHRKASAWWDMAEYVAVSFYRDYPAIEVAEKAAIRNEQPRFNRRSRKGPANLNLHLDGDAAVAAELIFRHAPQDFLAQLVALLAQPQRFPQPTPPPPAEFAPGADS